MSEKSSSDGSTCIVFIDMGKNSIRHSTPFKATLAELRQTLEDRKEISPNIIFYDNEFNRITHEAEQSITVKQLVNEKNEVHLKTNKRSGVAMLVPSIFHSQNKKKLEANSIQVGNSSTTTKTAISEIKIFNSTATNSNHQIQFASELNFDTWKNILEFAHLYHGVRMDKKTPEHSDYPAFEFRQDGNISFKPSVFDRSELKVHIRDKEMHCSYVSTNFFDGELEVSCPQIGIGVNSEYLKSKTKGYGERTLYKTRCDIYKRAFLILDLSYFKPNDDLIRDIDQIISLESLDEQATELEKFYKRYGHVYPHRVVLGGQRYCTERYTVTSDEEENKIRLAAETAFSPSVLKSASFHADTNIQRNSQLQNLDKTSELTWKCAGGDTLKFDSENIVPWRETIYNPLLWRTIEQDDYQPITTILDKTRQNKIQNIEKYIQEKNSNIKKNKKWRRCGTTVAGGCGKGDELYQLAEPHGICIDDDQNIYIADSKNHRIIRFNFKSGRSIIVAGGNGRGDRVNQLNYPTSVVIDKIDNTLIIVDYFNKRIVRWTFINNAEYKETLISSIRCSAITVHKDGTIYAVDPDNNAIKRRKKDTEIDSIELSQIGYNAYCYGLGYRRKDCIFVDQDYTLYLSLEDSRRIIKWKKNTNDKYVFDDDNYQQITLKSNICLSDIIVDQLGRIYAMDFNNNQIKCWTFESLGETEKVIISSQGKRAHMNQFDNSRGIAMDKQGNIYISDQNNHRIQKYELVFNEKKNDLIKYNHDLINLMILFLNK